MGRSAARMSSIRWGRRCATLTVAGILALVPVTTAVGLVSVSVSRGGGSARSGLR